MKKNWRIIAVTLLLITSSMQCSRMDGPEAAAKISFSEWVVNIKIPSRNENFQTINNDGTFSTVLITVELKMNGEWTRKEIEVQCEKFGDDWQCERSIQFK